jgi:hypothetical protein
MVYAIEMASGGIIYIPSFIKIYSGIQKLMGWGIHIQTAKLSRKPILTFQNKESSLEMIHR